MCIRDSRKLGAIARIAQEGNFPLRRCGKGCEPVDGDRGIAMQPASQRFNYGAERESRSLHMRCDTAYLAPAAFRARITLSVMSYLGLM